MTRELIKIDDYTWELPRAGNMRVPGRIYADEAMIRVIRQEDVLTQVANVATLPGILKASMAMPDVHQGYGFSIGGVAAFDWEEGVVSPGGVGYDINCGVRLSTTRLEEGDVRPRLEDLVNALYQNIPSGIGSQGTIKLTASEEKKVLRTGSRWAVENGFGEEGDLEHTEDGGFLPGANPEEVSDRALSRGKKQLGTLGSGNHFLEVGVVDEIYDETVARSFGLFEGQVTVMLHTGSRGLGYQICDDFLAVMARHVQTLPFDLPDRQLSCAMIQSGPGKQYLSAMACAANYAWANRQILMHRAREVLLKVLRVGPRDISYAAPI